MGKLFKDLEQIFQERKPKWPTQKKMFILITFNESYLSNCHFFKEISLLSLYF